MRRVRRQDNRVTVADDGRRELAEERRAPPLPRPSSRSDGCGSSGRRRRSSRAAHSRSVRSRVDRVGGIGVGFAVGWNIAVLGPIATRLSHVYGVSLAVVGAFVTVQFVMHMVMQIPGGRTADRLGREDERIDRARHRRSSATRSASPPRSRRSGLPAARVVGVGTGFALRRRQRLHPRTRRLAASAGASTAAARCSPRGSPSPSCRFSPAGSAGAPSFVSAIVVGAVCSVLLALAPAVARTVRHAGERLESDFFTDPRLYRLAAIHAMSFGFSVVIGNMGRDAARAPRLLEAGGGVRRVADARCSASSRASQAAGCSAQRRAEMDRREPRRRRRGCGRARTPRAVRRWSCSPRQSSASQQASRSRSAFTGAAAARARRAGRRGRLRQRLGVARDRRRHAARRPDVLAARRRPHGLRRPRRRSPLLAALATPR